MLHNHDTRKKQQILKDSDEALKHQKAKDGSLKPEKSPPAEDQKDDDAKSFIQKTDVLPGQCLIEQTFDLEKDLKALQDKYPDQYKPLLKREIKSVSKQGSDSKNSIKIMQFKLIIYIYIYIYIIFIP